LSATPRDRSQPYPDWLEFHSVRFGGPVASLRSRSGVVRLEAGEGETVERTLIGIPDDEAWTSLADALTEAGFWDWPYDTSHREPHRPGDWSWWLEVREDAREHRAAGWNGAPESFERVRLALYDLVEQVVK
jgi:hypothetical protein